MGIFFLYKKHPAKKIPDLEITCYRKEWVLFALCNIGTLVSIARNIFSIVKVVSILIANIVSILIAVEQLFLLLFFFFSCENLFSEGPLKVGEEMSGILVILWSGKKSKESYENQELLRGYIFENLLLGIYAWIIYLCIFIIYLCILVLA